MSETGETQGPAQPQEPAQSQPPAGAAPAKVAALDRTAPIWPGADRVSRLWTLARALASFAAVAFAVVAWTPWVTVIGTSSANSQQGFQLSLAPGDIRGPLGSFGWAALTVAGVLLLPLLWLRAGQVVAALGVAAYAIWAVVAAIFAFPPVASLAQGQSLTLDPNLTPRSLTLTQAPRYLPAYLIGAAVLALALVAAVLLVVGFARSWRGLGGMLPAARRLRAGTAIPGTGVLVGALLLWAAGTLLFPWATVNCGGLPLIASQCIGLGYASALRYGISSSGTGVDVLASLYAVDILLVAGAILLLIGVAVRAVTARFCLWAALWLAAATFFAFLGRAGVGYAIAHVDALGLPHGSWTGDTGLAATLLALVVALGANIYLWIGVIRARLRPST